MSSEDIGFWHEYLGRYLSDAPIGKSSKIQIETRLKRGVGLNTLGAGIDAHYIVTTTHAWLIGKIERESTDRVTYVPSDTYKALSGIKFIAKWLAEGNVSFPFMIGVIGKSNPDASFRVSYSMERCFYGVSGGGFEFNLEKVRNAYAQRDDVPWKTLAPAIHQHARYKHAQAVGNSDGIRVEKDKLAKMLDKTPGLRTILPELGVLPGSGEYAILKELG